MRRVVYRGGYIQFANLNYRGEHLEGYTGRWVVLRYNPRDITSILIYREEGGKDIFLSRAHATGLETETLSYAEAQAMSRRLRKAGKTVSNQSIFTEVQSRDQDIEEQQRRKSKRSRQEIKPTAPPESIPPPSLPESIPPPSLPEVELEVEDTREIKVPDVRVIDYEALKQEFEM